MLDTLPTPTKTPILRRWECNPDRIGIGILVVDRGRQDSVANRHQADDHLGHAGRRDQVSHHALRARHGRVLGAFAEHLFAGHRFHASLTVVLVPCALT